MAPFTSDGFHIPIPFVCEPDPMLPHDLQPRVRQSTPPVNLATALETIFEHHGRNEVVAFLDRGEHLTTQLSGDELRTRVQRCAARLLRDVPDGGPALLVLPAGPDFVVALLACIYAGIVAIPLPVPQPGASHERLDTVVADSGATAVVCRQQHAATIARHLPTGPRPVSLLRVDESSGPAPLACTRLPGFDLDAEASVLVQYTSGSTREPRGVALCSRNVLHNASYSADRWRCGADDVVVSWLPHFHDMGLFGGILFPLLWGARSVQMSPLAFVQKPLRWLRAVSQFRATFSGGPAFSYGLCLESAERQDPGELDLSSWKVACCGGEPIPLRLMQAFRDAFASARLDPATLLPCYGLAEATLLVAAERDGFVVRESDEAPGIEPCRLGPESRALLRIVDPTTRAPLPAGTCGEIFVGGASVSRGRFRPHEDPLPYGVRLEGEDGLFLPTGDLGRIDAAGLHVTGRSKDMLIAQGRNVAAVDVEWLAAEQDPALNPLAAAAFARDPARDEGAALVIEVHTRDFDRVTATHLIRAKVASAYGLDLTFVRFVKRGSLERTTSGKIRRNAVACRVRSGDAYVGVEV